MPYQIQIPKPCHERWDRMTPTEKGAFCAACQRDVIDFTQSSPLELTRVISKQGKICGRFTPKQLAVPLPRETPRWYSKLGMYLGVSSLFLLAPAVYSQPTPPFPTTVSPQRKTASAELPRKLAKDSITITGVVSDGDVPLPGVNVVLKGRSNRVLTDFYGQFSITVPKSALETSGFLVFSFLGFETQEFSLTDFDTPLHVELIMAEELLGEVVIVKQNIFRRIGNWFR